MNEEYIFKRYVELAQELNRACKPDVHALGFMAFVREVIMGSYDPKTARDELMWVISEALNAQAPQGNA